MNLRGANSIITPVISESYVFSRSNEIQHKWRLLFFRGEINVLFNIFFFDYRQGLTNKENVVSSFPLNSKLT